MVTSWGTIPDELGTVEKAVVALQHLDAGDGDIYYVDSNRTGAGLQGVTPADAFATLALGVAAASAGDTIIVLEGHTEAISTEVAIATAGLKIVGLGVGTRRPTFTVSGTINGVSLDAANILFENFLFNEPGAAGDVAIDVTTADCIVRNVQFDMATGEDYITVAAGGDRLIVEQCKFNVTGAGPDSGILLEASGVDDVEIKDNYFILSAGGANPIDAGGIETTAAHTTLSVHDNIFAGDGVAATAVSGAAALTRQVFNNSYHGGAVDVDEPTNRAELDSVGVKQGVVGIGNIWYVSSTGGNASYDGLTPSRAVVTVNAAIALATAGDTIYVMENHVEAITNNSDLVISKAVKVIGLGRGARRPTLTFNETASNIPISAIGAELHNFLMTIATTKDVVVGITVSAVDVLIKDVEMREASLTDQFVDAIQGATCAGLHIDGFKFVGDTGGDEATQSAINITDTSAEIEITNFNLLGSFVEGGIEVAAVTDLLIAHGRIEQRHTSRDECIRTATTTTGYINDVQLRTATDDTAGMDAISGDNNMQLYSIGIVNADAEIAAQHPIGNLEISDNTATTNYPFNFSMV